MYSILSEVGPGVCSNVWYGVGRRTAVIIIYESLLFELSHFYYDKSGFILFMHYSGGTLFVFPVTTIMYNDL